VIHRRDEQRLDAWRGSKRERLRAVRELIAEALSRDRNAKGTW
jgi:hypothetical protein